jgi:hypothetical protein
MSHQFQSVDLGGAHDLPVRSAMSREFDAFWRGLPRSDSCPHRSAFRPERAGRFLRHLVLCEYAPDGPQAIIMRLVGGEFEQRVKRNVKGEDYLQFLPRQFHAGALLSARELVRRPCGLWQITPLHYERGFVRQVEITIFPMTTDVAGVFQLFVLCQFLGDATISRTAGVKILHTDTALAYQYLDIGAGVPV